MRCNAILAAAAVTVIAAGPASAQDAAAGKTVFAKCTACHVVDKDQNKVGPSLKGLIGRTAGTHEGFKYSQAMIDAGKGGLVWNEAELAKYLHAPREMVKGTKMAFAGLKSDDDIANVIAYIKDAGK